MKLIKMLRTVEATSGRLDGDVQYTLEDSEADALIADGSAVLVSDLAAAKKKADETKSKKETVTPKRKKK
jgi:hypothetical protein